MPLQSSGIIVVDKTPIVATGSSSAGGSTANTSCRPNPPQGLGGGGTTVIGIHPQYNKQQQQQHHHHQQQFHEWHENDATASALPQTLPATGNSNSHLMRRQQRTIPSSSSTASSSSSQNTKALNLANNNFNQMSQINQQQPQSHHHQQHHHAVLQATAGSHPNQVIVSEEFIEHAGFGNATNVSGATTANVINLAANDLINQAQIIKLVSDGNGGNVLIDSLGNVTNGNSHHHGNSKLLVSNLTVLSKQSTSVSGQPQQTINFVNAKNIPYLTTAKNQTQSTAVQKIVNIPLKSTVTNNLVKQPTPTQIHHHHITNNSNLSNNGTTVMQKVTMPRNVQVLTRLQPLAQSSPQHQQSQRQQIHQQTNVLINQMIMQDKDTHNMVSAPTKINATGGLKKQTINQSMKAAQQQQKLNAQCTTTTTNQSVKAFVAQQQQQQLHQQHQFQTISGTVQTPTVKQVKSQKVVRQFTNNNNSNTAVTLTMQHQPRQTINAAGTYTINSTKLNNNTIQQQNTNTTKIISGNNSTKNTGVLNASTKYVMQNHIVLPAGATNSPSGNQNLNNKMGNSNNGITNNIVVQQQIINTINNPVCGGINTGNSAPSGTIKFVNAHGAVVHSQQHQQPPSSHQTIQQQHPNQKVRNNNIHHHHHQQNTIHITSQQQHQQQQQQQQQQHHIQQSGNSTQFIDASKMDNLYLSTFVNNNNNTSTSGIGIANSQSAAGGDDIVIVNGTQMTDEFSARILQSMSQKSVFNNNQRQQQQHHHQQHQQHQQQAHHQQSIQQHKIIAPPPPPVVSPQQQTNLILSSPITREYPIYNPINSMHIQHHRQAPTNTNINRSQSLDRKHYETQSALSKRSISTEMFRVNLTDSQLTDSTTTAPSITFIDNIPLPCPLARGDNAPAAQQAEHEDDIIGEEVPPVPVNTNDARLQALHAVLQDHTYCAPMPTRLPLELQGNSSSAGNISGISGAAAIASGAYTSGSCIMGQNAGSSSSSIGGLSQLSTSVGGNSMTSCGQMSSSVGFIFGQHVQRHQQHDDDANSVISNESRTGHGLDNDLGEETETAPEAEAEDDSVTRCICDLTHDDGYMICCDKCSAWQHVDCMGIDRQNIPDEYLCEICQPRQVDRVRARNLQLMKRKEQSQLLINAQLNAANAAGVPMTTDANGQLVPVGAQQDRIQPLSINTNSGHPNSVAGKKSKVLAGKKKDLLKKNKKDRINSKRRESKRTTKRKTKTLSSSDANQGDRYASNLRQWIENYEVAMTNHYSPELRARLHAISKQQNLLQQITATENKMLKTCGNLENRCTTVPHAGGKILISNLDIQPNSPIVELRGKYMLTTQYKTQNPSVNMNAPPTNCLQQSVKNQKIPGPFIYFYQLSLDGGVGPEICVDTRTYGNEARFVRRSCRPNAEIQHSFEKGTIHLYLVSLTNIMASTEITIRHEPHDLLAVENKTLSFPIAPTSTMCACGLTKDCAFGGPQPGNIKPNRKTVTNGCLSEVKMSVGKKNSQTVGRGRSTSSSGESNAGLLSPNTHFTPNLYSSASISSLMHDSGVYTSSSSPSVSIPSPTHTQAINSPPQQQPVQQKPVNHPPVQQHPVQHQQFPQQQQQSLHQQQHKPQLLQQQQQQSLQQQLTQPPPQPHQQQPAAQLQQQPQMQQEQNLPLFQAQDTVISAPPASSPQSAVSNSVNTTSKSPQKMTATNRKTSTKPIRHSISEDSNNTSTPPNQVEEKRESRKLTREERKMEAIVKAFEKMEKNQQRKQELKQARSSSSGSNAAKRRNSSSPSPKRVKTQSISESGGEGNNTPAPPNATQRKGSVSSSNRKKKRKASKSCPMQSSTQRKRRRSRMNSNDSDAVTSEESTSLLSPPIPPNAPNSVPTNGPLQAEMSENQMTLMTDLIQSQMEKPVESNVNQAAAGLLLALSNNEKTNVSDEMVPVNPMEAENLKSPVPSQQQNNEQTMPQTPQTPPIVSSACLLVEAAVGPLENLENLNSGDFKLPVKTKTKKSIMNDWLNQSNDFQQEMHHQQHVEEEVQVEVQVEAQVQQQVSVPSPEMSPGYQQKGLDTLVQAAASICDYRRTSSSPAAFMVTSSHDEPQNLSIVAKKVEEFIHQTDTNFIFAEDTTLIKVESPSEQPINTLTLPLHSSLNTSGSSSVKKRWLRQAISEETDEIAAAALLASSPTQSSGQMPNGFTTPLKKRRVIRQCNEEESINIEDLSLSKSGSESSLSNEEPTTPFIKTETVIEDDNQEIQEDSKNDEIKPEITEIEDEVDIITSPPPGEKIVADDNLVKIEPEDMSKEIKVDVEKEESCSSEVIKKLEPTEEEVKKEEKPSPEVEFHVNEIKAEELKKEDEMQTDEKKFNIVIKAPLVPVETDILVKAEIDNYESVSDEIADIQKRLHSFHKENIEFLQSRNRKSKIARSLKLALTKSESADSLDSSKHKKSEKTSQKAIESKSESVKYKESTRHRSSKKRHLNFDSIGEKEEKEHKSKSDNRKKNQDSIAQSGKQDDRKIVEETPKDAKIKNDVRSKIEFKSVKEDIPKIDDKQLQAALTIPNFNHNVIPQNSGSNPLSSYVMSASTMPNQSYDISTLLLAPPPPPPPTPPPTTVQSILPISSHLTNLNVTGAGGPSIQPPPLHLPYYNTIYGKLMDKGISSSVGCLASASSLTSSNLLMSDYLDTKAKSYSTLGGYVSHSALFGLNNTKANITGSLSNTSSSTTTSSASLDSANTSTKTCSKILTKTASADPRLNPILTAPDLPPAPKRKLSINEYRKRKQQSTDGGNGTSNQSEGDSKCSSGNTQNTTSSSPSFENGEIGGKKFSSESDRDNAGVEASKVQFSPAPTLLEQQQEILCERLKSLKSKSSSAVMSSLGVTPISGSLSSPDGLLSLSSSSASTLTSSSSNSVNCLNSVNILKDSFEISKRLSLSTSSLESISSSPSPISSKESTPERVLTPTPKPSPRIRPSDETTPKLNSDEFGSIGSLAATTSATVSPTPSTTYSARTCRDSSNPNDEKHEKQQHQNEVKVSR